MTKDEKQELVRTFAAELKLELERVHLTDRYHVETAWWQGFYDGIVRLVDRDVNDVVADAQVSFREDAPPEVRIRVRRSPFFDQPAKALTALGDLTSFVQSAQVMQEWLPHEIELMEVA